ncbi:MAG: leucyl aminopeptidase [Microbacteriaceae bacterium]|nr:leucyl aminopeptidase [Microbacteriaceae bacterium]
MTLPQPHFLDSPSAISAEDVLVVGLRSTDDGPLVHAPGLGAAELDTLTALARSVDAEGGIDSCWRQGAPAGMSVSSVLFTGLGSEEVTADRLREAAGFAALQTSKAPRLVVALADSGDDLKAVVEGTLLGSHRTTKHGKPATQAPPEIAFLGHLEDAQVHYAVVAAEAVWRVRDLVTMPPNFLNPASFVEQVTQMAQGSSIEIEVYDEKRVAAEGLGGINAVGQGSLNPPRLMILRYQPAQPTRHVALVGKGITFDSGGLSLKAPNAMVGMKYDMTGAAVMAASTLAASALGGSIAVTAYLCLAENMPSGSASRPNDVITIKGGKTVEILNTDAEGRLVMADGLSLASALNPDLIIDIATLTGAARIALGERYAGLMGTAEGVAEIEGAAATTGEKVWAMPLPSELRALLSSDVADIANAKPGEVLGGMLLAGVFLREFVGEGIPWAHLDIAGPANNSSSAFGFTPKGASGALTRTILSVLTS